MFKGAIATARRSPLRSEGSLRRLDINAIDLDQIHWANPVAEIEERWAALAELEQQGLVRHIGVSNFDVEQLRRIAQLAPVETLQPQYSLTASARSSGTFCRSPSGSGSG